MSLLQVNDYDCSMEKAAYEAARRAGVSFETARFNSKTQTWYCHGLVRCPRGLEPVISGGFTKFEEEDDCHANP